ncbi:hypothetical protein O181_038758 [Austropuccinia psidii MF-1]|uniref:Uncharacterized protein n=1 Tax=Austropuccinia psidii MF-1 TaxID=1389203 RepID=A0A9Q3HBA7_9BASI|nr:hypothetical protein [Austropuccinia psidii MF-1]
MRKICPLIGFFRSRIVRYSFQNMFFPFLSNPQSNITPLIIPSNSDPKEGLVDEFQPSSYVCPQGAQEEVDTACPPEGPSFEMDKEVVDESLSSSCPEE